MASLPGQPGTAATRAEEMPKIAGACPDHLPMFIGMLTLVCVCVIVGIKLVIIKRSTAGVCHKTPGFYVNAGDIYGANSLSPAPTCLSQKTAFCIKTCLKGSGQTNNKKERNVLTHPQDGKIWFLHFKQNMSWLLDLKVLGSGSFVAFMLN